MPSGFPIGSQQPQQQQQPGLYEAAPYQAFMSAPSAVTQPPAVFPAPSAAGSLAFPTPDAGYYGGGVAAGHSGGEYSKPGLGMDGSQGSVAVGDIASAAAAQTAVPSASVASDGAANCAVLGF